MWIVDASNGKIPRRPKNPPHFPRSCSVLLGYPYSSIKPRKVFKIHLPGAVFVPLPRAVRHWKTPSNLLWFHEKVNIYFINSFRLEMRISSGLTFIYIDLYSRVSNHIFRDANVDQNVGVRTVGPRSHFESRRLLEFGLRLTLLKCVHLLWYG